MKHDEENCDGAIDSEDAAAVLKVQQEKLLSYRSQLKSIVSSRVTGLAKENTNLEISTSAQITQLKAANALLSNQLATLAKQNQQTALLSKMNDFLQTSTNDAEAYSVISQTAAQLFPENSGAVFVLSASRDVLEAAVVWGALPPASLVFLPSECWAHRRGQNHVVLSHEQRCAHVTADGRMYACLPLLAQGETLGILHLLDGVTKNDSADEAHMAELCGLAKIFADQIGLGIANLKLRITMRDLSIRDPLTGLFNRRYMEEALAQEQYRAKRNDTEIAVIMIDIDHFKVFNDTYGHDGGGCRFAGVGGVLQETRKGQRHRVPLRW